MKSFTYTDLLIHISGEYLTDNLPKNYDDMTEEEVDQFLEDHAFQPFEDWEVNEVWELIENGADSLANFLEAKGIKIKR